MNDIAYPALPERELLARWRQLLSDPHAPERAELDQYGELIVAEPEHPQHENIAFWLMKEFERQLGGRAGTPPVLTRLGIRKPDAAWMADRAEWTRCSEHPAFPLAPTICAEVMSPGNSRREMNEKITAYLQAGAKEVVLVERDGRIRFFAAAGERETSQFSLALVLPPEFLKRANS